MTALRERRAESSGLRSLWGPSLYALTLIATIVIFAWVCRVGESRSSVGPAPPPAAPTKIDLPLHLLATLSAVIGLGFVLGRVGHWLGQPPVIGEVVAGIMLGPSLLGVIWPAAMDFLVPGPAVDPKGVVAAGVQSIATMGLVLYMFLIGLELNGARLRHQMHSMVAISHASIVCPFLLGAILALWLHPRVSLPDVPFTGFALFMGAAMSITAFPILARILTDQRLDQTHLGTVALGCAAVDDVTAWCLLAVVVGIVRAQVSAAAMVLVMVALFIVLMLLLVRPLVARWVRQLDRREGALSAGVLTVTFVAVLLSALTTESLGIHAVFGAFLLGAIIPCDSRLAREITQKLRDPVMFLLLPAFFANTGLRTQLGLVSNSADLLLTLVIIVVATLGKFAGAFIASRATGGSWALSSAIGILMNTRGLMELIVLNIGLELGIIGPRLFAMMVIMALVTTFITSPILRWIVRVHPREPAFQIL